MPDCTVTSLTVYPVKGCQGIAVDRVELRRGGIPGDRELMFVKDGESYSQLDHPRLARVHVDVSRDGSLRLSTPEAGSFVHERREDGDEVAVKLVYNDITVRDEGDALAAWACEAMGDGGIRVVSLPKPWNRWIPLPVFEPIDGKPQDRFYSVAPVLLNNQASLDDVNRRASAPVPMDRFRANVVVDGLGPFEEDELRSLANEQVELLWMTRCERCAMTTTDQTTGERPHKEPLRTLSQYRRIENGYASGVAFGAYMAVAREGELAVGDSLEVAKR